MVYARYRTADKADEAFVKAVLEAYSTGGSLQKADLQADMAHIQWVARQLYGKEVCGGIMAQIIDWESKTKDEKKGVLQSGVHNSRNVRTEGDSERVLLDKYYVLVTGKQPEKPKPLIIQKAPGEDNRDALQRLADPAPRAETPPDMKEKKENIGKVLTPEEQLLVAVHLQRPDIVISYTKILTVRKDSPSHGILQTGKM